jgi:hypothetical protein
VKIERRSFSSSPKIPFIKCDGKNTNKNLDERARGKK